MPELTSELPDIDAASPRDVMEKTTSAIERTVVRGLSWG